MDESAKKGKMERLDLLKKEHADLDCRLKDLAGRSYLSPEEQVEATTLKKLKLRKKDEIFLLMDEIEKM
ncbi:MAG: DUF465 domain-containing protein [Deltaproteobacteria bacterium]|nr:DUF465 domain-containing protein [Deltaproteobacteria bacterium]